MTAELGIVPYLLERQDILLWSINDRLGGGRGACVEPYSPEWMDDVLAAVAARKEQPRITL